MDIYILGQSQLGLYDAFKTNITPIFGEAAKVMFWCSFAYGAYYVMQLRYGEGVNRMKWAMIGYVAFKMADNFLALTDKIANNMKF